MKNLERLRAEVEKTRRVIDGLLVAMLKMVAILKDNGEHDIAEQLIMASERVQRVDNDMYMAQIGIPIPVQKEDALDRSLSLR